MMSNHSSFFACTSRAEPKKKKIVDPKRQMVIRERLKKKLRKLEKSPPQLIPISDFIVPTTYSNRTGEIATCSLWNDLQHLYKLTIVESWMKSTYVVRGMHTVTGSKNVSVPDSLVFFFLYFFFGMTVMLTLRFLMRF
uniref:Large ribosomal subunit protein mL40 n=1 Tax=Eptatretus burgeri TaxID=7764 RepID=A0A8C4QDM3_EPTBU